jgi:hypothetical protein
MFSLKCPSLLAFDERTKAEAGYLKNIYGLGTVPSDTPMRAASRPENHPRRRRLYANAPHVRQIQGYGWHFILNVKPESHASLEGATVVSVGTNRVAPSEIR